MNDAEAMMRQFRNSPRNDGIADRKQRFAAINAFVTARNGDVTSLPGAREVAFECLPGSAADGVAAAVRPRCPRGGRGRRKDGQLELVVPGSTLAVAETRTHERTRRNCMGYRFGTGSLPVPSHRGHGLYGGRG